MSATKKVLKKRTQAVATTQVVEPQVVETKAEKLTTIPSSRVSNYVSGHLLNKEFDDLIEKVKADGWKSIELSDDEVKSVEDKVASSLEKNELVNQQIAKVDAGEDLATVLDEKDKEKVGDTIKALEAKGAENIDIRDITKNLLKKRVVTHDSATVDVLSKKRAKFSKDSFNVLAAFGDLIVNEITEFALERLVEVGNSTIEPKYVFSSKISEAPLYHYYSQLPAYKAALVAQPKKKSSKKSETEEVEVETEEVETETETEEQGPEINFKFYVKQIVYQHKKSNEAFSGAKVSERYQKFCSDLVLSMLNDMVALSQIILQVMSTKTISANLFKAAIFTKTHDLPGHEKVKSALA